MKNYVVGFMFCKETKQVVLLKKNRPQWQKGQWNGIGGHIESYEKPIDAMIREFKEEAGVSWDKWENFLTIQYSDCIVYFFKAFIPKSELPGIQSMTDEEVLIFNIDNILSWPIIPNLQWIIPLALDEYIIKVEGIGK